MKDTYTVASIDIVYCFVAPDVQTGAYILFLVYKRDSNIVALSRANIPLLSASCQLLVDYTLEISAKIIGFLVMSNHWCPSILEDSTIACSFTYRFDTSSVLIALDTLSRPEAPIGGSAWASRPTGVVRTDDTITAYRP